MGATHVGRGIGSYSKYLAHAISDAGWRVTIIADKRNDEPGFHTDGPVEVRRVWREGLRSMSDVGHAIDEIKPSVVHVQHELFAFGGRSGSVAGPLVLRRLSRRSPLVTTIHGVIPPTGFSGSFSSQYAGSLPSPIVRAVYRQIIKSVVRYSTVVVVTTDSVLAALTGYCEPRRAVVVPHGVSGPSERMTRSQGLSALGLSDKRRAVFLGFLLPYKGIETLVAAAPALKENDVEVVIAGGPSGDARPTYLRRHAMGNGVVRLGFVPEALLPALFAITDVMVFPYTVGLSASGPLMLAAEYGVPVVVSNVPTLSGILDCPAATFRAGDAGDLVETVLRILGDSASRSAVTDQLRRLRDENSWSATGQRFIACYEQAMALFEQ